MKYIPSRILPHTQWKPIDNHILCTSLKKLYVIRFVDNPKVSIDSCQDLFPSEQFWTGISTRLVSKQYKKCDIHWKIKNKLFNDPWDGTAWTIMPKSDRLSYQWLKQRRYVGLRIDALLSLRLDSGTVTTKGLPDYIKDYCFVLHHTPIRGNFWHCDIFLAAIKYDGELITLNSSQDSVDDRRAKKVAKIVRNKTIDKSLLIDRKRIRSYYISKSLYRINSRESA